MEFTESNWLLGLDELLYKYGRFSHLVEGFIEGGWARNYRVTETISEKYNIG